MNKYLCISLSILCLLLCSCAAGVRHYYPPSIGNIPRSELVELGGREYPFIEAIDGKRIGRYMAPLYIEPGAHLIVVRPRKADYESDPVTIALDADAGEAYELSYSIEWSGDDRRSGVVTAGAKLTGLSEPPPHPLVMRRNGLVYIYRPQRVIGPATGIAFPVYLNGQPLQNLYPGSLCPVIMRPGVAVFSLPEGGERTVIDIEPDTVYYLKGDITMGGVSLSMADERTGEQEIRKTWLNALCHEVPRGYYPLVSAGRQR